MKRQAMHRLCSTRAHMLNMTLRDFADQYGISYGQAMDIEQMRSLPSLATRTLIEAVRLDPELIKRAASMTRTIYGSAIK
ncbi:hypothetical protein [Sphingomonas sp. OK281]|uniref:hypothetical protein n=1 Tax=Sphingomonas sp. OK281 TaxID=1881067 RepID=UPI000B87BE98|nr:hypothetical protein [Sphingomonas sp. OK281]